MKDKIKKLSCRCRFAESNPLCLKEIYVTAPTLGNVLINLRDYLNSNFIASYLLEVSF